jgi:hypothetical protein
LRQQHQEPRSFGASSRASMRAHVGIGPCMASGAPLSCRQHQLKRACHQTATGSLLLALLLARTLLALPCSNSSSSSQACPM